MSFRTDRHNNPVAFTTDIAKNAGLALGTDYEIGEPFENGRFHTARLLGDPIVGVGTFEPEAIADAAKRAKRAKRGGGSRA